MGRFGGGEVGRGRSFSNEVLSIRHESSFAILTLKREALSESEALRLDLQRSERETSTLTVLEKSYERTLAKVRRLLLRLHETALTCEWI